MECLISFSKADYVYTSKVHIIKSFKKNHYSYANVQAKNIYVEIFFIILIPEIKHLCLWW